MDRNKFGALYFRSKIGGLAQNGFCMVSHRIASHCKELCFILALQMLVLEIAARLAQAV